jgi:putative ABC transport system ATP-binding protein
MLHESLVQFRSVIKDYPMGEVTVHALRGLDLDIAPGEFIVLLGPSGSGKTTALNLIGGLDKPSDGHVIVAGEDIKEYDDKRLTDYRRRRVGFVFQFFNLIPTLTALENVEFALTLTDHDRPLRAIALDLLDQVGLKDRADHFPAQLSGGEQQRVAIARALANQPPILLCDEPTGNLDVETGQRVLEVIREVNQENGSTVIMVTHNAALAPMANRVIRLRSGEIDAVETNPEPRPVAELEW